MKCAYTGQVVTGPVDAIWDDGEWISWDWINGQIEEQELKTEQERYEAALRDRYEHTDLQEVFPNADPDLVQIFEDLIGIAIDYKQVSGRDLPVYGELGEIFGELAFGIKRNKPGAPGSDGRLGNDFIEIKTISPEKKDLKVHVKRQGNFNKLLVVRITEDFMFEARILDRKKMAKGEGKLASVSWFSMKRVSKPADL
jgi:hypothetical protein